MLDKISFICYTINTDREGYSTNQKGNHYDIQV